VIVVTPPTTPGVPPPAFRAASRHHYDTAQLAAGNRLRISADHLAGLAAECAIKAILLDCLGSALTGKGRPFHPELKEEAKERMQREGLKDLPQQDYMHGHLPWLWGQLCAVAGRRRGREVGPLFTQLIASNPFLGWAVEGRYCDETSITEADLARHLQAAYDLIAAHEQARTLGTGTLA
jgi:hypothetical protein